MQMTIIGETSLNTTAGLRCERCAPEVAALTVFAGAARRCERLKPIPTSHLCRSLH
jgi:hypothetical protein